MLRVRKDKIDPGSGSERKRCPLNINCCTRLHRHQVATHKAYSIGLLMLTLTWPSVTVNPRDARRVVISTALTTSSLYLFMICDGILGSYALLPVFLLVPLTAVSTRNDDRDPCNWVPMSGVDCCIGVANLVIEAAMSDTPADCE